MRLNQRSAVLGAILLASSSALAQLTQSLPDGFEGSRGSASTDSPFYSAHRQRWHFVYDAAEFRATYPILITDVTFRAPYGTRSFPAATYENFEMRLGASRNDYRVAGYDLDFDANWMPGTGSPHVFFSGTLNVPAGPANLPPDTWSIFVQGNPFLYDPRSGADFIVEMKTPAGSTGLNPLSHYIDGQGTTAGNNGGNRYGHRSDPHAARAHTFEDEFVPILRITYVRAPGIYASFQANASAGATPLTVQFTDTSVTSNPGGLRSWAWDLDGNGTIDSTSRNPSFTYVACGAYDVSLTATDATNATSTYRRAGFVIADPQRQVSAEFTASTTRVAVGVPLSFTDLSTGNPTRWSWDFESDGVPDSTQRNPVFVFSTPGRFDVSLTVANACFAHTLRKPAYVLAIGPTSNTASADVLEYQFNQVRGARVCNSASTNRFPAQGTSRSSSFGRDPNRPRFRGNEPGFGCLAFGVRDNDIDTGGLLVQAGSMTAMWWMRRDPMSTSSNPFGYVFGDGIFRCFTAGVAGSGLSFRGSLLGDFDGAFGVTGTPGSWQHVALVIDDANGIARWYSDGNPAGSPKSFTPRSFTYAGVTPLWIASNGGASELTAHFDLDDFRWYARALTSAEIAAEMLAENPTTCAYDASCADSNGFVPRIDANGAPAIGNPSFSLTASGMEPNRPCVLHIGLYAHLLGVLPIQLGPTGLFSSACALGTSSEVLFPFGSASGSFTLPAPVPSGPFFAGRHVYVQAIATSSGARAAVSAPIDLNVQL